ncbi:hypothetical protein C5C12_02480 [Pseudoclavibacter sp. RFBJ5]|nr:hypothetical protein C5C12_02480 [Pseudoclavibacter sp. RFBJ5]
MTPPAPAPLAPAPVPLALAPRPLAPRPPAFAPPGFGMGSTLRDELQPICVRVCHPETPLAAW